MSEGIPLNQIARLTSTFTFPEEVQAASGYKTVTVRELTPSDELRAARRAEQDPLSLAYEMAKEAVCAADDKPISTADESCDLLWVKIGPIGRNLVLQAHTATSSPGRAASKSFLESRVVKVG